MTAKQLEYEFTQVVETVRENPDLSVTVSDRPDGRKIVNVVYDTDFSSYESDLLVAELMKEYGFHVEYSKETTFFKVYFN
jgi:hypothetical protein